jgi:iron(III) transport system permease protein
MATIALWQRHRPGPPIWLVVAASGIALAMLLPAGYLAVRIVEEGSTAWDDVRASSARAALTRTALLAACVTASTAAIAVLLAWLTVRTDLPFRRTWTVLLGLPLAIPSYVGAYTIVAALGPRGMLQDVLSPLGVESLPEIYGFAGAWLTLTLFTFPYVLLPVGAAIRNINRSIEEAARSLGHTGAQSFLRVTLPQLRPAIMSGGVLVALYVLSDFGAVSILRFDSLSRIIYVRYTTFDRGSAATLAAMLVLLSVAVVTGEAALRGRGRYHAATAARPAPPVRLGIWKWPALAFCASVVAASVVLPVSVITYWLIRGLNAGEAVEGVGRAGWNSAYVAALAALVAVVAAFPVAALNVRYRTATTWLMEKAAYSGYALPGITIALALVFFAANYAPWVYQTMTLLVFGYLVRFLPQAVAATRSALEQVNPNTVLAARGLGSGRMRVFSRITLPQILPGVTSGGTLVFLTVMKELPVTLLLSPIGFETLATQVWSATSQAFFARAALPALAIVAISALPLLAMTRYGEPE